MRGDVCKTCPLGSAAVRELVYENFDGEIPENFKISCNGQCLDPWHFMTTHGEAEQGEGQFVNVLASGRGLATDSEAVLTVKVCGLRVRGPSHCSPNRWLLNAPSPAEFPDEATRHSCHST